MNETSALLTRHKLTVHDYYYRMSETGILAQGERTELIDGEIIDMPQIGTGHASTVSRITRALVRACGDRAIVSVQNPVRLDDHNEPQPDFATLEPRADFYAAEYPGPADIFLLIEVSDSSLRYDREVKTPIYAQAGIPEVWIVNLRDKVIKSYRSPSGSRFTSGDSRGRSVLANIETMFGDALGQAPVAEIDGLADRNIELVATLLTDLQDGLPHACPGTLVLPPGAIENPVRWLHNWPEIEPAIGLAWLGLQPDAGWDAVVGAA